MTPETALQEKLKKQLARLDGLYLIKIHGSIFSRIGTPDFLACYKGHFVAIETKAPGNGLTPKQEFERKKLLDAGASYILAYDADVAVAQLLVYAREWERVRGSSNQ